MRSYNKQDVVLVEELYERIKPWISNHPSEAAFTGARVCPTCGSEALQSRGWAYTGQSKYRRLQCNSCGKWSRDTKSESRVSIREVTGG